MYPPATVPTAGLPRVGLAFQGQTCEPIVVCYGVQINASDPRSDLVGRNGRKVRSLGHGRERDCPVGSADRANERAVVSPVQTEDVVPVAHVNRHSAVDTGMVHSIT